MAFIALGVTGGIGAYKAVDVARGLQKQGHEVVAIMTRSARRFVGPLTFEAITRRRVLTDQFAPGINAEIEHIALASSIDLLLVAPATANVIGKFAGGIADDFLSSLYLATRAPVLMAPAMNSNMLEHDVVRRNVELLAARGVRFVDPGSGFLACGWIGKGRLAEPPEIVEAAEEILRPDGPLRGVEAVVTAGPTYEDLDPVRYIGNRSSGRMGFALAEVCSRRGARVVLVSGPTSLEPPYGVETIRVRSAAEMRDVVIGRAAAAEVIIMAAAVGDYAPAAREREKIRKDADSLTVRLVKTPDILEELGRRRGGKDRPLLVGFVAETGDPIARAREKRLAKRVDLMVANDVSQRGAGFDVETNAVTIIGADKEESLPVQSKAAVAAAIVDRIENLLRAGSSVGRERGPA